MAYLEFEMKLYLYMTNLGNVDKLQTLLDQLVGSTALPAGKANCGGLGKQFARENIPKK
jgi:hypothetical protein